MCHRSVGLVASELEGAGMSTVTVSMRPDISLAMKVPRAVYVRFPLGNPMGEPGRADQQRRILEDLFELLESAEEPQVVELPYRWRRWL
jgi:D-proline reductase (dithiol) PrdB